MNKAMTKQQLIDVCNNMYRLAFEMGSNSYLFLPNSKISRTQLEFARINLLGAYELLLRERSLEKQAAAKYPKMAEIVRSVIGYIPTDDPIAVEWVQVNRQRTELFMQDWKNSVVIKIDYAE